MPKSPFITKKAFVVNVLKDDKGNTIITPDKQKLIDDFSSEVITEECPACEGSGINDGPGESEVCPICWGKGKFSYHTELKIVPISNEEMLRAEMSQLKGKQLLEFKTRNKIEEFTGAVKNWKKIPAEIQAISVDSRGHIRYYSSISGIYTRYDDEHTENKEHKGGQYWYFGSSLPGLDVTDKYSNVVIFPTQHKIFHRPGAKRVVFDFNEPFDWNYFPKNCTKFLITFGAMNVDSQEINICAGSKNMYLRNDNVIWGQNGRNHVDREFDIDLCRTWVDDGTNAYPIYKSNIGNKERKINEMNFELRNIPYQTAVYEIPTDRKNKKSISELKKLDIELCNEINKQIRPLKDHITIGQYPFKYATDKKKHEIEKWLLLNSSSIDAYTIDEDLTIHIDGSISIGSFGPARDTDMTELKYKFGTVKNEFCFLSSGMLSLKNLPTECGELVITHGKKIEDISITTSVTSGKMHIAFLDKLKRLKINSSIEHITYLYVDIKNVKISGGKVTIEWDKHR